MVILVFVVDTSASMNQRTSLGTSLLDVAKNAVESFVKVGTLLLINLRAWYKASLMWPPTSFRPQQLRQRDSASRTDRYMLVTFEEPPGAIKVRGLFGALFKLPSNETWVTLRHGADQICGESPICYDFMCIHVHCENFEFLSYFFLLFFVSSRNATAWNSGPCFGYWL